MGTSGTQERIGLKIVQPDVRRLIDLVNHLLNENYILREKLQADHARLDELPTKTSTGELSGDLAREHPRNRISHGSQKSDTGTGKTTSIIKDLSIHQSENGFRRPRPSNKTEREQIMHQIEDLRTEVQRLQQEFRSGSQLQANNRSGQAGSPVSRTSPKLLPIQPVQTEISFEADPSTGMWMKLRQPWFYIPLAWGTLLIVAALVYLLVFQS